MGDDGNHVVGAVNVSHRCVGLVPFVSEEVGLLLPLGFKENCRKLVVRLAGNLMTRQNYANLNVLYNLVLTTVTVVNHPGGMDNCALLPEERGLRVGRDILRSLIQIGAVLRVKAKRQGVYVNRKREIFL